MSDLNSQNCVMKMTLEITRAATGLTETVEVICTPEVSQTLPTPEDEEGETSWQ